MNRIISDDAIFDAIDSSRKHLWLVSMPKSGSTWLTELLQSLLLWNSVKLVPDYGRREQEIDPRQILLNNVCQGNLFSPQQHNKYSPYVQKCIVGLNIKVVLLTRNIYDVILSLVDHTDSGKLNWPMALVPDSWYEFSRDKKISFIIDLAVPWYANFFVGWIGAHSSLKGRMSIVSYENLNRNSHEVVKDVLEFMDIAKTDSEIETVIRNLEGGKTRLNKGLIGRGNSLKRKHKRRIQRLFEYYDGVDLSLLGL